MANLQRVNTAKSSAKSLSFNKSGFVPEKYNSMKPKINSMQYANLKTITIDSRYDNVVRTLPDEHYSLESGSKLRIHTSESSHSLQAKSSQFPKIGGDYDFNINNSSSAYRQMRLVSKNINDSQKEKVPMSKFLFKSSSQHANALSKDIQNLQNIDIIRDSFDPSQRLRSVGNINLGSTSSRSAAEDDQSFPFTSVLFRGKTKTPKEQLRTIENFALTRKVDLIKSPLAKKQRCEIMRTTSKFEKTSEFGEFYDKKFKLNSDASAKYKSTIQTIEKKNRHLIMKKPTNQELILKNKDKLLVCIDDEDADQAKPKFCFVSRSINLNSQNKPLRNDVELNIKIDEITRKLKLSSDYKHLYMLSGTPLFEFCQIPRHENVIVISRNIELYTVEHIISNDFVREFFESSSKQDIMMYSRSKVKGMDSILQGRRLVDDKFTEVLEVFDSEAQLNSEQLGRLVEASKTMKNSEFKDTMQRHFGKKHYNHSEVNNNAQFQSNQNPFSGRSDAGDYSGIENSDMDGVITDQIFNADHYDGKKTNQIEEYLEDKKPLYENYKLTMYREIFNYYTESMKGKPLNFEDIDIDEALKNIGISERNADIIGDHDHSSNNNDESSDHSKPGNIGRNLGFLLKRWAKNSNQKIDYPEVKRELTKMLSRAGSFMGTRTRLAEALEINHFDENLIDVDAAKEKEENNTKRDFVKDNKKAFDNKKLDIYKLKKWNRELFVKNIPKYIEDKNLSRRELHYVYILYKALCEVTSQRHKEYTLGDGIDYHSFKNGIYKVFLQSDEVAEKIFYKIDKNFSGFLNWNEFIDAMVIIRAKTMREKIDLFIKIADEDGNGNLSKDEVFKLAKICLRKFVPNEKDGILDDLCEYFTKLIFSSVNVDIDKEIPLESIKEAIISGNDESDLLAMFCGADI